MVERAGAMRPDVSVIVEWDNTALAGVDRARGVMARLADEVAASGRTVEVVICHDQDPPPEVPPRGPGLPPGWRALRVPDSRYYELKNHGAAEAAGDIVVFLDADAIPEPGWFENLLAPFAHSDVQVVAGHAYIQPDSLYSKAFALWWFFPLRAAPEPLRPVTHFFANNVAFRRATLLAHPFPSVDGTSRGACLALAAALGRAGITIWKTTLAQIAHPAPRGVRHFTTRALAQGRDRIARERGWRATPLGTLARLAGWLGAGIVRTFRGRRAVGLPVVGLPAALALCFAYYGLCSVGETAALLGVPAVRRLRV
jgi:hypothetical protein